MEINVTQYRTEKIYQALSCIRRGLTLVQICNQTSLHEEQVEPVLQELIKQKRIYSATRGKSTIYLINQQSNQQSAAVEPPPPPPAAQPAPQPEPPPPADNFVMAIYNDGRLLIKQGEQSMMLTPTQAKHLLAFTANWRQS